MTRAAEDGLNGLIFTFVFEPTVLPGFYERLKSAVEAHRGRLHPVQLQCSMEENVRRVQQPDRLHYLKITSTELLRSSLATGVYEPQTALTDNVLIDTTELSARQTAQIILERLSAK